MAPAPEGVSERGMQKETGGLYWQEVEKQGTIAEKGKWGGTGEKGVRKLADRRKIRGK